MVLCCLMVEMVGWYFHAHRPVPMFLQHGMTVRNFCSFCALLLWTEYRDCRRWEKKFYRALWCSPHTGKRCQVQVSIMNSCTIHRLHFRHTGKTILECDYQLRHICPSVWDSLAPTRHTALTLYFAEFFTEIFLQKIQVCLKSNKKKLLLYMKTHARLFIYIYNITKRLQWSRGSVLAFSTQVRGFKPGRSRRIFRAKKSSARLPSEGK